MIVQMAAANSIPATAVRYSISDPHSAHYEISLFLIKYGMLFYQKI